MVFYFLSLLFSYICTIYFDCREDCRSKRDSIKQRLNSLPSFPPFEIPGRKFSVFSRFRKISRTNRIREDEIYEPENKVEVIKSVETALWKISKGFERPRESRPTLNKEGLNRTESFGRTQALNQRVDKATTKVTC